MPLPNDMSRLSLDDDGLTRGELVAAMAENPVLIERPVVFRANRAAVGRPPKTCSIF
jgi:arsenate reductase